VLTRDRQKENQRGKAKVRPEKKDDRKKRRLQDLGLRKGTRDRIETIMILEKKGGGVADSSKLHRMALEKSKESNEDENWEATI